MRRAKLRLVALSAIVAAANIAAAPPNIILILADDLGYGDLGCYGSTTFRTPNLDRLAAQGARFTQFNTPAPVCAPVRAALLTGRYPHRCGLVTNPAPDNPARPEADGFALPATEILFPELLRRAGYATTMIGKWHLGHKRAEWLPTARGFDDYFGLLYSNDMRPVQLFERDRVVEYPVVQTTLTRRYTERALAFLERQRTHPFFLYFAHMVPHKPLAPGEAFHKKSGHSLYADAIAELDWSVGQLMDRLKALGLEQNTLVMFTSDNGPYYGGSTGGLRGMKGTAFEGGYRVPTLLRWPGVIPAGTTSSALGITMDLFATTLAAAGVASPSDRKIDGADLLPVLKAGGVGAHEVIFGNSGLNVACVRDARWKLHVLRPGRVVTLEPGEKVDDPRAPDGITILAPSEQMHPSYYPGVKTGDAQKPMMLFDLENDPAEQTDVAAWHPEVVARLRRHYDSFVAETNPKQIP